MSRSSRIAPWAALLLASLACGSDPPLTSVETDPAKAEIVTSDIDRFWAAYDAGGSAGSAAAFQAFYLDRASPGLADFISLRRLTAASLAQTVTDYPRYFASVRPALQSLGANAEVLGRIRANYRTIKSLYPAAVFPPATFLVGRFSTAGTVGPGGGILVGAEFDCIDATTPLDELGQFQRDNVRPVGDLPIIVAHEHTHVLQGQAGGLLARAGKDLLDQALLEGSADFVGELVSGGNINARLFAFALPREKDLWARFQTEMRGTDVSSWLYNQGTGTPEWPGDLGYFVGYRIAQAFYRRAEDKALAVRSIVEMRDGAEFLAQSGYAP